MKEQKNYSERGMVIRIGGDAANKIASLEHETKLTRKTIATQLILAACDHVQIENSKLTFKEFLEKKQ